MNTYGYVGGNPVGYIDQYGLCTGYLGIPCSYGIMDQVSKEAPVAYEAIKEGTADGLMAIGLFYGGVSLLPRAGMAYATLSEGIVLSDTSILAGIAARNAMVSSYEAASCLATDAAVSTMMIPASPLFLTQQQRTLDFINSLFPGPPVPNIPGAIGGIIGDKTNPEEVLR